MKTLFTSMLVMLLVGILTVGAFAQDGETPDETKKQNFENVPGLDGNGGIVRNGGDYAGVGGAHGPMGPGNVANSAFDFLGEDMLKVFGEDCDGTQTMDGQMLHYRFGPGESTLGGLFGPNEDGVGFGPGGDGEGTGEPDPMGDLVRARVGRR